MKEDIHIANLIAILWKVVRTWVKTNTAGWRMEKTDRESNGDTDGDPGCNSTRTMPIVLRCEKSRILEGSVG